MLWTQKPLRWSSIGEEFVAQDSLVTLLAQSFGDQVVMTGRIFCFCIDDNQRDLWILGGAGSQDMSACCLEQPVSKTGERYRGMSGYVEHL